MRNTLVVDRGTVHCPRRGDIDVERCYACMDLLDIRQEGPVEVIVCDGFRRIARDQMLERISR